MFLQLRWKVMFLLCWVILMLASNVFSLDDSTHVNDRLVVKTTYGLIRGKSDLSIFSRKPFIAFKGVPYAEPPLNELRFKPPVSHRGWNDTRESTEFGADCLQLNRETYEIVGSEDCLFMNIYVPDIPNQNEKFPVMLFIHGGGFQFGSGNHGLHGPDFIIDENVILVTINYRLGALGFLSLGTPEYSGNAGLKDQIFALKWVHENIQHFGGDKNRITLCGHSAGAASVHFHILSQASRGLYQRSIVMAATVLTPTVYYDDGEHLLLAFHLAQQNGNPVNNYKDLVKYLHQADAKIFLGLAHERHWLPVTEVEGADQRLLSKTPNEYMESTIDVEDILIGFSSSEALLFIANKIKDEKILEQINENLDIRYPGLQDEDREQAMQEVREYYFGPDGVINNETVQLFVDLFSDVMISFVDSTAKTHAKNSNGNVYYYRLSSETSLNWHKIKLDVSYIIGATHGDELCYLFRCHVDPNLYNDVKEGSTEMRLIREVTKLWTNYIKYGNPTPNNDPVEFKPIEGDNINFLDIGVVGLVPALGPHGKAMVFWKEFREKYVERKETIIKTEFAQLPLLGMDQAVSMKT